MGLLQVVMSSILHPLYYISYSNVRGSCTNALTRNIVALWWRLPSIILQFAWAKQCCVTKIGPDCCQLSWLRYEIATRPGRLCFIFLSSLSIQKDRSDERELFSFRTGLGRPKTSKHYGVRLMVCFDIPCAVLPRGPFCMILHRGAKKLNPLAFYYWLRSIISTSIYTRILNYFSFFEIYKHVSLHFTKNIFYY